MLRYENIPGTQMALKEAVRQAIRERLARLRRERAKRRLADELDAIALECAALPVLDDRPADQILGYDGGAGFSRTDVVRYEPPVA